MKEIINNNYDSDEESMNDESMNDYPQQPIDIDATYNHYIPNVVRQYQSNVKNVRGNGSCGYYAIQEGLKTHGIPFEDDMNKFRKSIYDYLFRANLEDIYVGNPHDMTKRNRMKIIWDEDIEFNDICDQKFYFEAGIIMPIVSKMFDINVVCYSIHPVDKTTIACIKKENKQELIWEGGHLDPLPISQLSMYDRTVGMLHVNSNHYMYLDLSL